MTRLMSQISLDNYFTVVQPKLTEREAWVLEGIENLQPCSVDDVADHYKVGSNIISGRFTGLKNKRKIVPAFKKLNKNGNMVQTFKTVGKEYEDTQ